MDVMIGILIFTLSVYLILRELEEDWDVENDRDTQKWQSIFV